MSTWGRTNPARSPDWIRQAWRSGVAELCHFVATGWEFTRRPGRFARRWRGGETDAMNPIGFLGTSAVFVSAVREVAFAALGAERPDSLIATIASALGPYAHYAMLALICHYVMALRRTPGKSARARDSVAFALYAGRGPAAAAECLAWVVAVPASWLLAPRSVGWLIDIALGAAFSVFCTTLTINLGILHDSRWRMPLALTLSVALVGLFFGVVHPPGQYGMHWVVTLWGPHGELAPRLNLGL